MNRPILCLLIAGALASCSKSENPAGPDTPKDGVVRIFTGIDGSQTKAVVDASTGITSASFLMKETATDAPTAFTGTTYYTGSVASSDGKVTFSGSTPKYNLNNDKAWFVAYYPAQDPSTNSSIEWDINGYTDIMITDAVWAAGNYAAPISGVDAQTKLNFNHCLSQVEVICIADQNAAHDAVKAAWGQITKIEFISAPTKLTYDLSKAVPSVAASVTADFTMLKSYSDTEADRLFAGIDIPEYNSTNPSVNAVAMLAPVTPTGSESFKLRVTTAGALATPTTPISVEISVNLNATKSPMEKGKTHKVTLTFNADGKNIDVTKSVIDDWGSGASGTNSVEKPTHP